MTRHGTILPTPDDPRIASAVTFVTDGSWARLGGRRSQWLGEVERILREHYSQASSRDLSVTARSLAPFPLRDPP